MKSNIRFYFFSSLLFINLHSFLFFLFLFPFLSFNQILSLSLSPPISLYAKEERVPPPWMILEEINTANPRTKFPNRHHPLANILSHNSRHLSLHCRRQWATHRLWAILRATVTDTTSNIISKDHRPHRTCTTLLHIARAKTLAHLVPLPSLQP